MFLRKWYSKKCLAEYLSFFSIFPRASQMFKKSLLICFISTADTNNKANSLQTLATGMRIDII